MISRRKVAALLAVHDDFSCVIYCFLRSGISRSWRGNCTFGKCPTLGCCGGYAVLFLLAIRGWLPIVSLLLLLGRGGSAVPCVGSGGAAGWIPRRLVDDFLFG